MVSDVIGFVKTIFLQLFTWLGDLYDAVGAWSYIIPMFIIFLFVGYAIFGSPGGSSGSDEVKKDTPSNGWVEAGYNKPAPKEHSFPTFDRSKWSNNDW